MAELLQSQKHTTGYGVKPQRGDTFAERITMSNDKRCRGDTLLEDRKQLPDHRTVGVVGRDLSEALSRLKGVFQQHVINGEVFQRNHKKTKLLISLIFNQFNNKFFHVGFS